MIVARSRGEGSAGTPPVELHPPHEGRHVAEGPGALLLGFPAAPDRRPWRTLDPDERERLLSAAVRGEVRLAGRWTLLARDGGDLVVRTDEFGNRPLFWRADAGETVFADEIWSLLGPSPALDPMGVADFLASGAGIGERTLFEGVNATRPDCILRARGGRVERTVLPAEPPDEVGPSLEESMDAMERELERTLDPFADAGPVLVSLSGGLDSRTLLALAREAGLDAGAFTFALRDRTDEELIARRVAAALDVPLAVLRPAAGAVSSVAREFVRRGSGEMSLEHVHAFNELDRVADAPLLLNGQFGDVICGGSRAPEPGLTPPAVASRFAALMAEGDPRELQSALPGVDGWADSLLAHVASLYREVGEDPNSADRLVTRDRPARFNGLSDALVRHRVESAASFLDGGLSRACYGIDLTWRRRWDAYRGVVLRRWPELAAIPWEKTGMPLDRFPKPRPRLIRAVAQRLPSRRPRGFTDTSIYFEALAERTSAAPARLAPVLREAGIDVDALLLGHPPSSRRGGALRLRLATLEIALELAGIHPS